MTTISEPRSAREVLKVDLKLSDHLQKLWSNGQLCDVTLKVDTLQIKAHKAVLSSVSPVFLAMWTSEINDEDSNEVTLKRADAEAVESLVKFIYTGEICIDIDNVKTLYQTAHFFEFETMKSVCEKFMIRYLDVFNACEVYAFARFYNANLVIDRAGVFISEHFSDISVTQEFFNLSKNDLVSILCRSDLGIKSEKDCFEAIVAWIDRDFCGRVSLTSELLQNVRLTKDQLTQLFSQCSQSQSRYFKIFFEFLGCNTSAGPRGYPVGNVYEFNHLGAYDKRTIIIGQKTALVNGAIYVTGGSVHSYDNNECHNNHFERIRHNVEREPIMCDNSDDSDNDDGTGDSAGDVVGDGATVCAGDRDNVGVGGGEDDDDNNHNDGNNIIHGYNNDDSSDDNNDHILGSRSVHFFSPKSVAFLTRATSMIHRRRDHACCGHAGKLYVCGGKEGMPSSSGEVLTVGEQNWTILPEMNEARYMFQLVSCGDLVWALGGSNGNTLDSIEYYQEERGKWETSKFCMNEKRATHSAVAFRSNIFIIGGYDGKKFLASAEVLDTDSGQCTVIKPMQIPLHDLAITINGHEIICFSDCGGALERYNLITGDWEKKDNRILKIVKHAFTIFS